jgi:cytochrome c oxidase cbb3-type subunit 3
MHKDTEPAVRAPRAGRSSSWAAAGGLLAASLLVPAATLGDDAAGRGEALYRIYCTQCHGLAGDGRGVNTRDMAVQPRDHTDTGEMSARTDQDLAKAIRGGGKAVNKSVLMPAWGENFSDEDIDALVAYLRVLCCSESR